MAVILAARDLTVGYAGRAVLSGVTLEVATGAVIGLVGANGCGKSTLIRTLIGVLEPIAGRVELEGHDAAGVDARSRARRVGYVPQIVRPAFPYRVDDFVLMGRAAHVATVGRPGVFDRATATAALAELGIAELASRPVTELSGGQLQLVLLARALAQEPAALVLDEPASSLDFGHQARLLELLRRQATRGMAVLMSTHHPDHVLTACDQVVLLSRGRVQGQGTPEAALTGEALTALYGVPMAVVAVPLPSGGTRRVCVPS